MNHNETKPNFDALFKSLESVSQLKTIDKKISLNY